jgi:hypothetical protein
MTKCGDYIYNYFTYKHLELNFMDVVSRSPAYNIYENGTDLCRHIKFRHRGITQQKEYNTIYETRYTFILKYLKIILFY